MTLTSSARWRRRAAPRSGLAKAVWLTASLVAVLIVLGIVLVLAGANPDNEIVRGIHKSASWLTSPFHNLIATHRSHNANVGVNWGLAAAVYLIGGRLIARLLARF